jgi:SAM-dependent methyltransferase
MRDNTLLLQILTIAHVYGHNDFFKNNFTYRTTRAALTIELFKTHALRVRRYTEDPSIGVDKVEHVLDAAHALSWQCRRNLAIRKLSHAEQLERLVEAGELPLESLHPGGLETTRELADLCGIATGTAVLDLACGTGESACFLAEHYGTRVVGIDLSDRLLERARRKAPARGLDIAFARADLQKLPFADATFDAAICECTLCLCDKERALTEMARVIRRGGRVRMHDLYWRAQVRSALKNRLAELEGERPETLTGWEELFRGAGLADIVALDRSEMFRRWMKGARRQIGVSGLLSLGRAILRRWGLSGLLRIMRSERIFSSKHLGYCIVVGSR